MTHEAHESGRPDSNRGPDPDSNHDADPESHDCTYADRADAERRRRDEADLARAHAHRPQNGRDFDDIEERRALIVDIRTDGIDPDTGLFRKAVAVPYKPAILEPPAVGLVRWVRLGPWGPSMLNLVLLRVKPRDCWLLATLRQHPLDTWFAVLGFVPDRLVGDREYVGRMVNRVIYRNGIPGHVLWKDHLPTHVLTSREYFNVRELRELVFAMAGQMTPDVLREAIDDLRAHPLDPWGRCEAEVRRAARTPSHQLGLRGPFPERELLETWWELITDPDHIRVETSQIDHAWVGRMPIAHHSDPHPTDPDHTDPDHTSEEAA